MSEEGATPDYMDKMRKMVQQDSNWLINQLSQLSPLNRPEQFLLMSLQVMALIGGTIAYPYHLLTRKDFGERYVSLLAGFMYMSAMSALVGTISSGVVVIAMTLLQAMSGSWIISIPVNIAAFIAFFVRRKEAQKKKKAGVVFYSRYAGTPIIWEKYFKGKSNDDEQSLRKFKLVTEPVALLILGVLSLIFALSTGLYFLFGLVSFCLISALGTWLPEFYKKEKYVNQLLDMIDEQEESRLQQEAMQMISEGKSVKEITGIDKTQSFESIDKMRRYADQFEKARKIREGAKV